LLSPVASPLCPLFSGPACQIHHTHRRSHCHPSAQSCWQLEASPPLPLAPQACSILLFGLPQSSVEWSISLFGFATRLSSGGSLYCFPVSTLIMVCRQIFCLRSTFLLAFCPRRVFPLAFYLPLAYLPASYPLLACHPTSFPSWACPRIWLPSFWSLLSHLYFAKAYHSKNLVL